MSFYKMWEQLLKENINDQSFIEAFLKKTDASREILINGCEDDLFHFINFLNGLKISKFIDVIDSSYLTSIEPNLVIQFSNFELGIHDVVRVIEEQKRSLTFDEIGMYLLGKRECVAMKKYGESHSKLAQLFDLVVLSSKRPVEVSITKFGAFSNILDERMKKKVFKLLALRDPLIRNVIYRAKQGLCKFVSEVSCLSETTIVRRRSNVKQMMNFILKDSDYEYLLDCIEW